MKIELWIKNILEEYGDEGYTAKDEQAILLDFAINFPDLVQEKAFDGMTGDEAILLVTDPLEFASRVRERIWSDVEQHLEDYL